MIPETISAHAFVAMIYIVGLLSIFYVLLTKLGPTFWNILYTDKPLLKEIAKLLSWFVVYFAVAAPMIYVNQFF
jgi:hypothetical protein